MRVVAGINRWIHGLDRIVDFLSVFTTGAFTLLVVPYMVLGIVMASPPIRYVRDTIEAQYNRGGVSTLLTLGEMFLMSVLLVFVMFTLPVLGGGLLDVRTILAEGIDGDTAREHATVRLFVRSFGLVRDLLAIAVVIGMARSIITGDHKFNLWHFMSLLLGG